MGLPEKPLPPEELKAKAEKEYQERQDRLDRELFEMRKRSDIKEYVADNITPVILENKEQYSLLLRNEDRKNVELFVYQYIDQVYQETGKAPDAKEVLDSMEEELWSEFEEKASFIKNTDRGKKFFNLEEHLTQGNADEPEEAPAPPPLKKTLTDRPLPRVEKTANRPWHTLTRAEKLAEINKGNKR
jgi:uncharacterized membrane-anchored protein YhcB (DUF1043 family)